MKNIRAAKRIWEVEMETVENDLLVIAKSGDKTFCDWVDCGHFKLADVDHADGCENLTEKEEDEIREAINEEFKETAEKIGYTAGYNNCGYDGTLEDAIDDEAAQDALKSVFEATVKYIVQKYTTEIPSYKAASKAYEGMTLDEELNRGDISPDDEYEFNTEEEAREFLNSKKNTYFFNGSGYGEAEEWYMTIVNLDGDGEITNDSFDYYRCPNSDFEEFKKEFQE